MPVLEITSADDPRIAVYRDLPSRKHNRDSELFIAEGRLLARRLLASPLQMHSLLLDVSRCGELVALAPQGCPVYIASRELLQEIAGFAFHAGVIACAYRPAAASLASLLSEPAAKKTLTVCDDVYDVENVGSMLRTSLALGSSGVICGPRTADPFHRRALRLSMGAAFKLPLLRTPSISETLAELRVAGFDTIAAVADEDAEPLLSAGRNLRCALVLGNEADGLSAETLSCCNRRVTIPMHQRADSLNVSVAAGIFLHHFLHAAELLDG